MKFVKIVNRTIPLWILLFCFLVWGLATMGFGWAVKSTLAGSDRSGFLGQTAVKIANFPTTAKEVIVQLTSLSTGEYVDEAVRVRRDPHDDYSNFTPVPTAAGIDVQGLLMRGDPAAAAPGWRMLVGAFTVNGELDNAALLISPDFKIVRTWILKEIQINEKREPRPKFRKFIHGLALLDDGSLIFTFDGSVSLQRFDACGERLWAIDGQFHHAVTLGDNGTTIWTLNGKGNVAQVSVEDGTILRQISMHDVIKKNPMIDILEIRRLHEGYAIDNRRNTEGAWMSDPFHFNDVDPLPSSIADQYENFEAGDLLVSARALNLVFVVSPDTLKVKWWRIGTVQRQHDPDWGSNGEITVLNNRMSRDFSEIVALDPHTFERKTVFDGRKNNFYTRIRGKHQITDTGNLIVASPQQGSAFEVNSEGDVIMEFANTKPGSDTTNYTISEVIWRPVNGLDLSKTQCEQYD